MHQGDGSDDEIIQHPGFTLYDGFYLVDFMRPVRMLSSAPINGGYGLCSRYVNRTVPRNFSDDPVEDSRLFLRRYGIDFKGTCMTLTACDVESYSGGTSRSGDHFIYSWVTAGASNAISMGSNGESGAGTVNIAVATDAPLSDSACFNLIQSIVEAKTQLFNDLGIRDLHSGKIAPGTSTDTVSLFVLSGRTEIPYAGRLTAIGRSTADLVYDLVGQALSRCK